MSRPVVIAQLLPFDPARTIDVAERSQGLWEKGWQSATAGVLLAVFLLVLGLLLRTAYARNKDRKETEAVLVALVRENGAHVAENGKQTLLFQHMLSEQRADIVELKRMVADLQRGKK